MSNILKYVAAVVLLFVGLAAFAQDKTQAYYNTHESEILPDAQVAFSEGNYDRAARLCEWYYINTGKRDADELKGKAERCAKLTIEMNAILSTGQKEAARDKAQAILALNPDDKNAQELSKYDPGSGVDRQQHLSSRSGPPVWCEPQRCGFLRVLLVFISLLG